MFRRTCLLATMLLATAASAERPPLLQSPLWMDDLKWARGVTAVRMQNVVGDGRLDLLLATTDRAGMPRLEVWERRSSFPRRGFGNELLGGETPVLRDGFYPRDVPGLPPRARDLQGLYVPAGIEGAGRDLVVLGNAGPDSLGIYRNLGPGADPAFELIQQLSLPGARRFHFPMLAPIAPNQPGYVNLPLPITLDDGSVQLLQFEADGAASLLDTPLQHPGGAADVLLIIGADSQVLLLTLGAGQPWLWQQQGDGYVGGELAIPGWPADVTATHGLLAEFDGDFAHRELIVAFDDGQVLRLDGVQPDAQTALAFDPPQPVLTDVAVTELVEFEIERPPGSLEALVVVAEAESFLLVPDTELPGRPFATPRQRLSGARGAFGDFALNLLVFAWSGQGVSIFQRAGAVDGSEPFGISWETIEPIPIVNSIFNAIVFANPPPEVDNVYGVEAVYADGTAREALGIRLPDLKPGAENIFATANPDFRIPAGVAFDSIAGTAPASSGSTQFPPITHVRLKERGTGVRAPLRDPILRPTFRVDKDCTPRQDGGEATTECLLRCFSGIEVPPALVDPATAALVTKGAAANALFSNDTAEVLRRLRANVLAQSPKGREYTELYARLSLDFYAAMIERPSVLLDYAAARDAWMPAIRSLVDGDGQFEVSVAMVDRIDSIADHLMRDGGPAVRTAVEREWRLLRARDLIGSPIVALLARMESLPTERIFDDGFEQGPTTP